MQDLDAAFFALSDPTRRAILARLALGEATVMELTEPFELTQPAISRHLKVLEGAGLIARRVDGTTRPCRVQEAGIRAVEQWMSTLREALARNYDRLDAVLARMQATEQRSNRDEQDVPHHRRRSPRRRHPKVRRPS
jgi:DNA-binding transcriptional ArsR family regulator